MQSWNTTSKTTTTTAKSMTASEDAESFISCHALTVEGDGVDGLPVPATPGCDSYFTTGISSSEAVSVSASLRRRFRVRSSPAVLAINRRRLRPLQKKTYRPLTLVWYCWVTVFRPFEGRLLQNVAIRTFYLLDRAAAPRWKYAKGWVLGWTRNTDSWKHFAHPFRNFTGEGVEKF